MYKKDVLYAVDEEDQKYIEKIADTIKMTLKVKNIEFTEISDDLEIEVEL